jgi:hypothetical protein
LTLSICLVPQREFPSEKRCKDTIKIAHTQEIVLNSLGKMNFAIRIGVFKSEA